ncbi:nuclear transport factor 2 family protein [Paucibacter sp. APW11]|uniref:Nuclear transport factor 2 family protein n=1 Tax=Roseateles aquae TaxID=3077235 RepID=A0ABU3P7A3_9BURK|nr:nuclear transport factor 2 family protein [Paucibacter sp. APW11]MDT8998398.1 nuclear transport factor 2 family protein [Paucibacter sp. APW11]
MPATHLSPEFVAQRQLEAYNARDVEAWLSTYAEDAVQYLYPGTVLARGHAEMRARIVERFAEPDLHAQLLYRSVIGEMVCDHELVTRNLSEGLRELEMQAIYQIHGGLIRSAMFYFGSPRLRVGH